MQPRLGSGICELAAQLTALMFVRCLHLTWKDVSCFIKMSHY